MTTDTINVGDYYIDCAHHPILCTVKDGDDLEGQDLVHPARNGACSIHHCAPEKITRERAEQIVASGEGWGACPVCNHAQAWHGTGESEGNQAQCYFDHGTDKACPCQTPRAQAVSTNLPLLR